MLTGRNIVCVSTIDWSFLWQQHQAIMSVFARHGNRVLFIENTGVRTPGLRDLPRVVRRLQKWGSGEGRYRPVMENIYLFSPLALPFPYSRVAQKINRRLVCQSIRRWLARNDFHDPIMFSFLPTQFVLDLMEELTPAVSVYYCTTNFAESSPAARQIARYETKVVAASDIVLASARGLVEQCRRDSPHVHLIPIGVSLEKFDAAWNGHGPTPREIAPLKRPIIGYVGGLHRFVDQELIRDLSRRMPDNNFVLVGPAQTSIATLENLPNVHLVGVKPHEEIPQYIQQFDVCLIPYVLDAFTDSVSPAKLNEYLALGKPVISSNLPEVQQFNREFGDVVDTASGVDEFAARIEGAVREQSATRREHRRHVAQSNSWLNKVETMSALIEDRFADHRARRQE